MDGAQTGRIDPFTIVGLAMLLLPLTTMWHEIGGHAAACFIQGGHVATIGAFYVDCTGLSGLPRTIVACAGVAVDMVLAALAWAMWRRATGDLARLVLWYLWIGKGFVAAGYFCFSGVTGVGDLGATADGGIGPLANPWVWRGVFLFIGGVAYWQLISAGIRSLNAMLGNTTGSKRARQTIAHLYYLSLGIVAVLVGLLNPLGIFITVLSAMASSFGGNAGLISIGFAVPHGQTVRNFAIARSWGIVISGLAVTLAFAVILGPSQHF